MVAKRPPRKQKYSTFSKLRARFFSLADPLGLCYTIAMYEVRCDIREDTRLTALEVKAMHDTTMQYCMDHGYGFRETWDGMLATIPPGGMARSLRVVALLHGWHNVTVSAQEK
jgi:hypothetical protein